MTRTVIPVLAFGKVTLHDEETDEVLWTDPKEYHSPRNMDTVWIMAAKYARREGWWIGEPQVVVPYVGGGYGRLSRDSTGAFAYGSGGGGSGHPSRGRRHVVNSDTNWEVPDDKKYPCSICKAPADYKRLGRWYCEEHFKQYFQQEESNSE